MKSASRRVAALAAATVSLAAAVSLGVAGCSSSRPTTTTPTRSGSTTTPTSSRTPTSTTPTTEESAPAASVIVEKAKANALAAKTGAFSGQITEQRESMKISFKGTNDGSTSDLSIDMGAKGKVRLLSVGGGVYMQADGTFWTSQGAPAQVQRAGQKFIKAPAAESALAKNFTINAFLQEAFAQLTPDQVSDQVEEATVDGADCWVVTDKKGKQEGALYVSKAGYQLVRFTGSTDSPGQIDFSSWNQDLGVTAPPPDQILNLG